MGRPLFSTTIASSSPVVRVEPEAQEQQPFPEPWSYRNNFDPDADEFFDDAVYEAFIDPNTLTTPTNALDGPLSSDPRTIPLEGSPINSAPASEASTPSESPDPMLGLSSDAIRRILTFDPNEPPRAGPAEDFRFAPSLLPTTDTIPRFAPPTFSRRRSATVTSSTSTDRYPHNSFRDGPIQVYLPSQTSHRPDPRLYTWAQALASPSSPPQSPSFSGAPGPLTNPNARMSLAHLAPSRVRVQDVFTTVS